MDWRTGTDTMTDGEVVTWHVDADEIVIEISDFEDPIYLSERQAECMITGLSYQLSEMRKARGRA